MSATTPIVSTITAYLAPSLINRMASSLGLGQGIVAKALQAAVPGILAGIAASVTKSGGTTQLCRVLAKNDASTLRTFASVIGSSGQEPLMDGGANALVALLGVPSSNVLASAIGRFTGLNPMQSSSVLGLLTPVVLGHLAQAQRAAGLDGDGLARQLVEQSAAFVAAMPPGFARLIADSGLIPNPEQRSRPPSVPVGVAATSSETTPATASNETAPLAQETAPAMTTSSPSAPPAKFVSNDDRHPSIAATIDPSARVYAAEPAPVAFSPDPALRAALALAPSISATIPPPEVPPQPAPVVAPRPLPPLDPIVVKPAPSPSELAPIALSRPSIAGTLAPGAQVATHDVTLPAAFAPVAKRPDIAPSVAATLPPGAAGPTATPATLDGAPAVAAATTPATTVATPANFVEEDKKPHQARVDVAAVAAAATVVAEIARTTAPSLAASASKPSMGATMSPAPQQQEQTAAEPQHAIVEPRPQAGVSAVQPPTPSSVPASTPTAPTPDANATPAPAASPQFKIVPAEPARAGPIPPSIAPTGTNLSVPQIPSSTGPTALPSHAADAPRVENVATRSSPDARRSSPDARRIAKAETPGPNATVDAPKRNSDPWAGIPPPPSRALGVLKRLTAATLVSAALAAGLWGLATKMPKPAATTAAVTANAMGAIPNTAASALAQQSLARLTTALNGVTDEATARAAVAELESVARDVRTVRSSREAMTADERQALSQLVKSKLPEVVPAAEKAMDVEAASALISPILTSILADFDVLAGA